jgi:hypothetical protein
MIGRLRHALSHSGGESVLYVQATVSAVLANEFLTAYPARDGITQRCVVERRPSITIVYNNGSTQARLPLEQVGVEILSLESLDILRGLLSVDCTWVSGYC